MTWLDDMRHWKRALRNRSPDAMTWLRRLLLRMHAQGPHPSKVQGQPRWQLWRILLDCDHEGVMADFYDKDCASKSDSWLEAAVWASVHQGASSTVEHSRAHWGTSVPTQ